MIKLSATEVAGQQRTPGVQDGNQEEVLSASDS